MARALCYCRRFVISTESATYVKNGVPLCNASTCQKVAEHRGTVMPVFDNGLPDETLEVANG